MLAARTTDYAGGARLVSPPHTFSIVIPTKYCLFSNLDLRYDFIIKKVTKGIK